MDIAARVAAITGDQTERLHALFDLYWEWQMFERPEDATAAGEPGHDDRWGDRSLDGYARRRGDVSTMEAEVRGFVGPFSDRDATDREVLARELGTAHEGARFPEEFLSVGMLSGPQRLIPMILGLAPVATDAQRADFLARLEAIPQVLGDAEETLSAGMAGGVTQPRVAVDGLPDQAAALADPDSTTSPLLLPLREAGATTALERATRILADLVAPAFDRFATFLRDSYLPRARTSIGMSDLPDGADWYAHRIKTFTTTDLTAEEIHQIGITEVERISGEMEKVAADAGLAGDLVGFRTHLREADEFYFDEADALVDAYRAVAKQIDPGLPKLFGSLPRQPYGVEPVPSYMEKRTPTAYYMPGSPEAGRPGMFYANTYDLRSRPAWEMDALTLHEAVPGHHLQIAIAHEIDGMPKFRRFGGFTAYIEGWGLYAENLGDELGLYADPPRRYGKLAYEMWRAGRLVVDTGMHALGWERQRAIDYLVEHTGKAQHDIEVEVDRYIGWPGQALAYKIGELKIMELRDRARAALGADFDIRAFHDEVLGAGALPLNVLERRIDAWIAAQN